MSPDPTCAVCWKLVGLPIMDRSIRRRRFGAGCSVTQQAKHCTQMSPILWLHSRCSQARRFLSSRSGSGQLVGATTFPEDDSVDICQEAPGSHRAPEAADMTDDFVSLSTSEIDGERAHSTVNPESPMITRWFRPSREGQLSDRSSALWHRKQSFFGTGPAVTLTRVPA